MGDACYVGNHTTRHCCCGDALLNGQEREVGPYALVRTFFQFISNLVTHIERKTLFINV